MLARRSSGKRPRCDCRVSRGGAEARGGVCRCSPVRVSLRADGDAVDEQHEIRSLRAVVGEPWASDTEDGKKFGKLREEPPTTQSSGHKGSFEAVTSTIDAQTMERITKELATYIGPIAEIVVMRAARRCSSVKELCNTVAHEIDFESDRVKFFRSCK